MASLILSYVVKIENIPWSANALDIRKFFAGLNVPEGGVHIIGGEKGLAFVGFASDEDCNKAMQLQGGIINNSQVNLLPSNRGEMAEVIEKVRSGKINMAAQLFPKAVKVPALASSRVPYPANARDKNSRAGRAVTAKYEKTSRGKAPSPVEESQPLPELSPVEHGRKRSPDNEDLEGAEPLKRHRHSEDFAPAVSVEPQPTEWFVELQNLQKDVTRTQIVLFMHDCKPVSEEDLVIVPWMGRALVRLKGTSALRDNAMKKTGEIMRGMSVTVVEVTIQEFAMAQQATKQAQAAQDATNTARSAQSKPQKSPPPPGISRSPPQLPSVTTEYIKLAGLPLQYQWHNIRALFPSARLAKDGLKLEKNSQGQFTGIAFLKFTNLEECGKALERLCNMKYEVTLLTRDEYERGVAADGRATSAEPSSTYVNPNVRYVAVRNVEETTTAEDVCGIFKGLDINASTDVVFRGGAAGYVALVRLKSEADQQAALRRNRSALGRTTVVVEPAAHADFEQAQNQASLPQFGQPGCSIMLQNLNPTMEQSEVLALVEPFQPIPDTLRMHYDESGRATGRALIAFPRPEYAQRASASLNGQVVAGQPLSITVL